MRRFVAATLALVLAAGCATLASGPGETIAVTSEPSGANVSVDCGSEKNAFVTPAHFVIARKSPDCTVAIEKEGFEKETALLERGINRWTWLNVPVGLVGITILGMSGFDENPTGARRVGGSILLVGLGGLVIDRLTWRFHDHDPKTLHVKLRPAHP